MEASSVDILFFSAVKARDVVFIRAKPYSIVHRARHTLAPMGTLAFSRVAVSCTDSCKVGLRVERIFVQ